MAMPPPPQPFQIDLKTIVKESRRITEAHPRHFLALSVLFLLPLSLSFSAYPFIYQLFSQSSSFTFLFFPTKTILFSLLYAIYVLIFSLLAISSVTYSVFHGIQGRPLKLVLAIKSGYTSFPRLLSTCLVSGLMVSRIFLILGLILFSLVKGTQHYFDFEVHFSSPYFIPVRQLLFKIIFFCTAAYVQTNWPFAPAVVVVESSWGLVPLKRSKNLVRGMRRVAFFMFLVFGFFIGIFLWSMVVIWDLNIASDHKWETWLFVILYKVFYSTCFVWSLLSYLAATTVFYVHSKAIHGEPVGEIAKELPTEYAKLPHDDDGKVPHVASIV